MVADYEYTVHVAGPIQREGRYQTCARCGEVLTDDTAGPPCEDGDHNCWIPGGLVAVNATGDLQYLVERDHLREHEYVCEGRHA